MSHKVSVLPRPALPNNPRLDLEDKQTRKQTDQQQ